MIYTPPCVFGKSFNVTPTPSNYQGLQGWYQVPCGWFCRRNDDGTISASPNKDFSNPLYDVKVDTDGYMKIQNLMWNAQTTRN